MSEPTILPQYRSTNTSEEPTAASKPDQVVGILLRLTGSLPSQNFAVSLAYDLLLECIAEREKEAYRKGYADAAIVALRSIK